MLRRCFSTVKALHVGGTYQFQLRLPSVQACWFTFPATQTVAGLQQAIKEEDPLVASVSIEAAEDAELGTLLGTEQGLKMLINQEEVTLVRNIAEKDMSKANKSFLTQFLEVLTDQKPTNKEELDTAISKAVENFREETVSKVERLKAKITALQGQISTLEAAKQRLDRKIDRRVTVFSFLGLSFMTAQWGWFFYTIYMVDWLGWDLMEPITYSVGQLGFLLGVWSFVRFRTPNSFHGMAQRYRTRKLAKLARRHNLDLTYLEKLTSKRDELQSQVKKLTNRLARGGPLPD